MNFHHISVLPRETIDSLQIHPDGIYVDGTLGGGGHASLVAEKLGASGRLIGIDQDADAILAAGERLAPFGDRVTSVRDNYVNIPSVLLGLGLSEVDGIYLDLGVSSYQLDTAERGFSFMADAPLDMRMDRRQERTAAELVNEASEQELARIIRVYGEDRFSNQIARRDAHLSGASHCGERRAYGARRGAGTDDTLSETGRTPLHHHLPLAGRQNRERGLSAQCLALYLSPGFPGLCLRKEKPRTCHHRKTHRADSGGSGEEPEVAERKTPRV